MITIMFIHGVTVLAQNKKGVELYRYSGYRNTLSSLSSRAWYQADSKWYGEVRYNYEEEETFACSIGRTFAKQGGWNYAVTPTVGMSVGRLQGVSLGANGYLSYKGLSLSSSVQYGVCPVKGENNLFSWSELDGQLSKHFYGGCTLQQLCAAAACSKWEPGVQIGFSAGSWSIPLYVFDPASGGRYFVIGICKEWKK